MVMRQANELLLYEHTKLWMGTHPSCPSTLLSSGQSLKDYLSDRPELCGPKVVAKFGSDLPFLFKVRLFLGGFSINRTIR